MTAHTLAISIAALWIFQVGIALGLPKDTRPWTGLRKTSLAVGVVQLTFTVWLVVTVLG